MPKNQKFTNRLLEVVSSHLDLPKEEEQILEFWEKEKIFEKSVEERPADKSFVFYDGPPTANGKPGIHHVISRAFKDALPRYKTMQGFRVERKAGWDTHGLPVELQVEKELGISGKPQIENIVSGDKRSSIAKFNELCKQSVWKYKDEWERLTKRMGFWLDLEHPYITYENNYIESLWWILKQVWDRGLLYEDFKIVPYCPRCGTSLSSHEVALGYDEVVDRSVYVKFPVKGKKDTYLIAWTTTPWTLPGNVALAVGGNIEYGIMSIEGSSERYIIAKDLIEKVIRDTRYEIRDTISGKELVDWEYEPLFDIEALESPNSYKVYEADFVSTEDGSGIVHTAVMYGEDDFVLGTKVGLPKHHTVDLEGKFTADVEEFAGQFVKAPETERAIVKNLKERGLIIKEENYKHTYPFCWRCKTPLLYYGKSSWFIKMSALRDGLIESNQSIKWVPDHLKDGRFGEWLRELKDWALSRDRYWGTPLPIWKCTDCSEKVCVGSRSELGELGGEIPEDLHKPYIDDVVFDCKKCKGTMERYSEVIDVWFDSGAMPFAQWSYPFDKESKDRVDGGVSYPADYIAEGVDQTRGWFYTLLAVSHLLEKGSSYKAVISNGLVLDEKGKKMSKSVGNVIDPWELIGSSGIDPVRFFFYSVNQPGENKLLGKRDIENVARKTFMIAWNIYSFLAQSAQLKDWQPASPFELPKKLTALDEWLVSRTSRLVDVATKSLEDLDFFHATREISDYINDLSTWYLRLSRKRTDDTFLPTLYFGLKQLALVLAPFCPFFSEVLWQKLKLDNDPQSIHLALWPTVQPIEQGILDQMAKLKQVVELGRAKRAEYKIKVRQPLAKAIIEGTKLEDELTDILIQELNVKSVEYVDSSKVLSVELDTEITRELAGEGLGREIARSIQDLRKQAKLNPGEPAKVFISGNHDLFGELKKLQVDLENQTSTQISWTKGEGENKVEVEGIEITLIV